MRLLVLTVIGGRSYLGRTIVAQAVARGHDVTVFGPDGQAAGPDVTALSGDRESGDYRALVQGRWDAVVDVNAYLPRQVREAAAALRDRCGHYTVISSTSVYADGGGPTEDAPLVPAEFSSEQLTRATYGHLKVACEEQARMSWPDRCAIIRPGLASGPDDAHDRLTYWVRRAARGGRMALPGKADQLLQIVDGRDTATLALAMAADHSVDVVDSVGAAMTLTDLARTAAGTAGSTVELVEVDPASLPAGFPLVDIGYRMRSGARAAAAGQPATPLARTIADIRAWDRGRGEPPLPYDVDPELEAATIARHALG